MRIKLTNFGCWKNNEFEFKETGLNLLSGNSGMGKSTCLKAIIFALYGIGTKVVTDGCTACKVELWFEDLHIIRSKGPCRLVVNNDLEDDEAQAVIDQRVGDVSMVYLEQNGRNTFVNMTPIQKLEFLERITFSNTKLKAIKDKLSDKTKGIEHRRLDLGTRLDVVNEKILITHKPVLSSDISNDFFKMSKTKGVDAIESKLRSDISASYDSISKTDKQLVELREYELLFQKFQTNRSNKQLEIERLKENVQKYETLKQRLEKKWNKENLEILQQELDNIRMNLELTRLEENKSRQKILYDELVLEKKTGIMAKLNELYDASDAIPYTRKELGKLIKSHRQYSQIQESIQNYKQSISELNFDKSEYKKLQDRFQELNLLIEQKTQLSKSYSCPVCSSCLQLDDQKLICVENRIPVKELKTQIKQLTLEFRQVETNLSELGENRIKLKHLNEQLNTALGNVSSPPTTDISVLETQYESIDRIEYSIKEAETELDQVSMQFGAIEHEIKGMEEECEKLRQKCVQVVRDRTDVEEELADAIRIQTQFEETCKILKTFTQDMNNSIEELVEIEKFQSKKFQHTLSELEIMRKKFEQLIATCTSELTLVQKIREFLSLEEEFHKIHTLQRELVASIETEKQNFTSCVDFKKLIAKAEAVAIKVTIDTLNIHVQNFLDAFFVDEPMSAQIVTLKSKGTKTEREQLNIEILYKGMNMDIKMLSGGEYDRVVLAFMMSIMDMNQSPIVLLDECISSLDQDTADNVSTYIQTQSKDRCVVLIAHQIITGMFDHVIKLKKN
jgi:DNA repair exonuclease SbcCD ATPase subunit